MSTAVSRISMCRDIIHLTKGKSDAASSCVTTPAHNTRSLAFPRQATQIFPVHLATERSARAVDRAAGSARKNRFFVPHSSPAIRVALIAAADPLSIPRGCGVARAIWRRRASCSGIVSRHTGVVARHSVFPLARR